MKMCVQITFQIKLKEKKCNYILGCLYTYTVCTHTPTRHFHHKTIFFNPKTQYNAMHKSKYT